MGKNVKILLALFVIVLNISCSKTSALEEMFGVKFNTVTNAKTVTDVKNLFTISLNKNWKTELYYDSSQSKIYSADTTQTLSSSFILEATQFDGKLKIDSAFIDNIKNNITALPRAYVLKNEKITFKEKEAFCVYSYQKTEERDLFNIQLYIADRREYYLLESKIFGGEQLKDNIQKSISIFDSFSITE